MNLLKSILFAVLIPTAAYAEKPTIVIDPGHQPWTKSDSWYESGEAQANIKFARSLESIIKQQNKYDVFLTLNEKEYDPLLVDFEKKYRKEIKEIRVDYTGGKGQDLNSGYYYQMLHVRALFFQPEFKTKKADLFVSVHHNEPGNSSLKKMHGFCIYYSNENKYAKESKELAKTIKDALVKAEYEKSTNGSEKEGMLARDFTVVHHGNKAVPSVLMELGYISNKQDKEDANNDEKVAKKAKVIYDAIDDFLSRRK